MTSRSVIDGRGDKSEVDWEKWDSAAQWLHAAGAGSEGLAHFVESVWSQARRISEAYLCTELTRCQHWPLGIVIIDLCKES